jgi:phospholipase C
MLPAALNASFSAHAQGQKLDRIQTVVVIYAENRSFDNLYGHFPGANGLQNVTPEMARQVDRDGTPLKELPPIWGGLTGKGIRPPSRKRRPNTCRTRRSRSTIRTAFADIVAHLERSAQWTNMLVVVTL